MSNWIIVNLQAAFSFFNAMMQYLYDILTIDPTSYRGGTIWAVVVNIYDSLLGVSISLCILFFYVGILGDVQELIVHRKWEIVLWDFIKFAFMSILIICGKYLLLLIYYAGEELTDAVVVKNGVNILGNMAWVEVPDKIVNMTNGIGMSNGIIMWVVTLLAAIIVMVSCFTIMLIVYGRLFKIFIYIAVACVPISCATGRATMSIFVNFIKSFAVCCLQGLIIVISCLVFSAFANGFDINNPIPDELSGNGTELGTSADTEVEFEQESLDSLVGITIVSGVEDKADKARELWIYLGETIFTFLLFAGVVKGSDNEIKRWVGV